MGALSVILFVCICIAAAGILPTILGIGFLILYTRKRRVDTKQKKIGLILPAVSVCIGEALAAPLGFAIGFAVCVKFDISWIFLALISLLFVLCGIILCVMCAVKVRRGKTVSNGLFAMTMFVYFIDFCICALFVFLCCICSLLIIIKKQEGVN